jgi:hypothetical protein
MSTAIAHEPIVAMANLVFFGSWENMLFSMLQGGQHNSANQNASTKTFLSLTATFVSLSIWPSLNGAAWPVFGLAKAQRP